MYFDLLLLLLPPLPVRFSDSSGHRTLKDLPKKSILTLKVEEALLMGTHYLLVCNLKVLSYTCKLGMKSCHVPCLDFLTLFDKEVIPQCLGNTRQLYSTWGVVED
jgi:hypothetical protein